ncbi:MAG: metallophosphoesterase [Desulfobacteraceae bacterium]|jgi:predicted MPP superfamily phosphohydrolase
MSRLVIFLSLYLSVYGSAHLYLLIKARRAFYLHGVQYFLLFAIFTFLLLAPINARLLEAQGQWVGAAILGWIGFTWMGFVLIFVCLALPVDGYHLLVGAGQHLIDTDWTSLMLSKQQSVVLITLISCAVMVYGAYEAYHIKTEKITITSSKISDKTGRIRIVQISDLHIGPMFYPGRLDPVIEIIEQAQPDILVSTGDLIDGHLLNPEETISALHGIKTRLGKYAVTGNHEYYAGLKQTSDFIQKAGFTPLHNKSITISDAIVITGVDDPAAGNSEKSPGETELLTRVPDDKFSLLLKHRPEINTGTRQKFDLQLSGHTHKGQILPFQWMVRLSYPLGHGLHQVAPERHIYVSRGTGTWGPPIRVLAPPEITIIDLVPSSKGEGKK